MRALKIESIANTTNAMTREADNTTIALVVFALDSIFKAFMGVVYPG